MILKTFFIVNLILISCGSGEIKKAELPFSIITSQAAQNVCYAEINQGLWKNTLVAYVSNLSSKGVIYTTASVSGLYPDYYQSFGGYGVSSNYLVSINIGSAHAFVINEVNKKLTIQIDSYDNSNNINYNYCAKFNY